MHTPSPDQTNGQTTTTTTTPPPPQPTTLSLNLQFIFTDPDELVAYSFAGEEHFSPEFIQSLASPFQHSTLAIFIPCLLAPLSLLAIYTWASPLSIMASNFSFLKVCLSVFEFMLQAGLGRVRKVSLDR
jgi:hypothetical protein